MAANHLAELIEEIEAYASASRPPLSSVLVQYRGEVLVERYWQGFAATSYQPVFSITKSVVSALVGLALADGKLSLSDTLARWYPKIALGSRSSSVSIQHLLTMTAGFEPLKQKPDVTSDPIQMLLERPLAFTPGQKFHYTNEDPDLLVDILSRAVGQPVLNYAQERLFAPLGIWQGVPKSYRKRLWKTNKQGNIRGGFGLHLTTRELASFGQLYIQCGMWHGEQLLPKDYVTASTTAQASGGYPEGIPYGYFFWVATTNSNQSAFFASGMGGQYIYVVPSLDLVVVITTPVDGDGRPHRVMITRLVTQFLESKTL